MRLVFVVGLLLVGGIAVDAQDHPGAEPYRQVCQLCHGAGARGDIAPALVPLVFDADYVLAVVREGYSQMPPISSRELSDDQVRDVVGYLESLFTPEQESDTDGGDSAGPRN